MKNKLTLLGCLLLLPHVGAEALPPAPWNVTEHRKLRDFIIQSHRGAGGLSTDNTQEAFELGWKLGTYPEADVRTTKDGVIVGFHDNTFKRVVKDIAPEFRDKGVKDLAYEELARFDVGSWKGPSHEGQRIPRLSDIFALMKGRPERHLYLDIKEVDLKKLAAEVSAAGVGPQVVLASPSHKIIQNWKKLVPDSETLIWIPGNEEQKRKSIEKLRAANFSGITQVQIHINLPGDAKDLQPGEPFSPSRAFLTEVGRDLAARGILFQTLPWKAADPGIYHQLLDVGCASFASDHPDVTRQAVADYYEMKNTRP